METLAFGITEEKMITLPDNCTENASEDCQQITFGALPAVEPELERIAQAVPATKILLDKDFKQKHFQAEVGQSESPIVHLATHGQFSSAREETFVLADDGVINVEQFAEVLEAREKGGDRHRTLGPQCLRNRHGGRSGHPGAGGVGLAIGRTQHGGQSLGRQRRPYSVDDATILSGTQQPGGDQGRSLTTGTATDFGGSALAATPLLLGSVHFGRQLAIGWR